MTAFAGPNAAPTPTAPGLNARHDAACIRIEDAVRIITGAHPHQTLDPREVRAVEAFANLAEQHAEGIARILEARKEPDHD